jgi:hypothetical protein
LIRAIGGEWITGAEVRERLSRLAEQYHQAMITSNGFYNDELSLEEATMFLRELLFEFPFNDRRVDAVTSFVESRSQAVQLAAMLSQFGSMLIPKNELRLGFIYNANSQRSGKSLLAKIVNIPVNGRMATQSWNIKDEELRKVLDAEIMAGSRYIVFDNVRGHMASPVLEAFMTAPVWRGRILGTPRMFEAANLTTVYITGNDMTVSSDMAQRCLICDLFVQEANVQDRTVSKPISDAWLMETTNRQAILSALWAIIRHWDAAGRPLAEESLRVGYQRWCEVFGGLVQFAGFGDCLAMPSEVESEVNTEMAHMKALVKTLSAPLLRKEEAEQLKEYEFQDVVNAAHEGGYFTWMLDGKEVIEAVGGRNYVLTAKSNTKFGRLLHRYAPPLGARVFRLTPLDTVRLSSKGTGRHKRFVFEQSVTG